MIIKHTIKNLLRSKTKTALFFVLIFSVALVFGISLSVVVSINDFLKSCGENYTTTAVIEYLGADYPDSEAYDSSMNEAIESFDFSLIEQNENVILWDRAARALGYVEGYQRTDRDRQYADSAVLLINGYLESDGFAYIEEILYAYKSRVKASNSLYIYPYDQTQMIDGHSYIIHGYFVSMTRTHHVYLQTYPYSNDTAALFGITDGEDYIALDVTDVTDEELKDTFYLIAETYEVISNCLNVYAVSDLSTVYEFSRNTLNVAEGREFTQSEYENGANVCIVSPVFANAYDVKVGDTIPLSLAVGNDGKYYESFWAGEGFDYSAEFEIVGITNAYTETKFNIYIPKSEAVDYSENQVGYTIGTAIVENDGASDFYNTLLPMLPDRMTITIYDGGYARVKESFGNILYIAEIVLFVCVLACGAMLILFLYLFILKRKEIADIMFKLGTKRINIAAYFMLGAGIISLLASLAASFAAYSISKIIVQKITEFAYDKAVAYSYYSNSALDTVQALIYSPAVKYIFFVYTALGITLSVTAVSRILLSYVFKKKKGMLNLFKIKKRIAGNIIKLKGKSLKYAIISAVRGGARSLVVPLAVTVTVVFLCNLSNTYKGYMDELALKEAQTEITGVFTDIYGKQVENAVIEAYQINDLANSGYIDEINVFKETTYYYMGRYLSGEFISSGITVPEGEFALETFLDNLERSEHLISTNSIRAVPEFKNASSIEMSFLDGYDETFFESEIDGLVLCMVSTDFMEENGVSLGDTIQLYASKEYTISDEPLFNIKVVGSFVKQSDDDNIYCQLGNYVSPELLFGQDTESESLHAYTLDNAYFVIEDTSTIDEFKKFLMDYGFSSPQQISTFRTFIILQDEKYLSSLGVLKQQIKYINVLYPILYVLSGVLAFIMSVLVIRSRKSEFTIMRGLGAEKKTVFFSFFAEQAIIIILGTAIGLITSAFVFGGLTRLGLLLVAGFSLCYFAGCAWEIFKINRLSLLNVLKYEE